MMGSQEPSVRIAPDYQTSDGLDAVKILRAGGIVLDEWQVDALCDWMGRSPAGLWAASTCGGSVPRQNGKSLLVQARAEAGMLLFNEQVIYTAHLQKTASETFEEMRDFFEMPAIRKYVADIKSAIGREQIILKSGARIKFLARTRNSGRGQHGDLLLIDEAQEIDENARASLLPAISASLNPQTIYTGTPPDPSVTATVFRDLRQKVLQRKTKKTAWFEFSVPEIGNVTDQVRWAQTNPALGRRILLATIQTEMEQMDPDTFARERLGWWAPVVEHTEQKALDPELWAACASGEMKPEGKTAYGIKFSPDGSEICLCGAVVPADGPARISLIERKDAGAGIQWLADWLNERYKTACCVVIDGRNGVDLLVDRISSVWRYKGSVIRPSAKDMIAAASLLQTELTEQTVTWYDKQTSLEKSALTSIRRPIGGGWGFGGEDSAPIEAASLALWGARTSKRDPGRRMRIG
jgi:hypothetical protein